MSQNLGYKQMIQKQIPKAALQQFSQLYTYNDWEGLMIWHKIYTPWCNDDTVQEYIKKYMQQKFAQDKLLFDKFKDDLSVEVVNTDIDQKFKDFNITDKNNRKETFDSIVNPPVVPKIELEDNLSDSEDDEIEEQKENNIQEISNNQQDISDQIGQNQNLSENINLED